MLYVYIYIYYACMYVCVHAYDIYIYTSSVDINNTCACIYIYIYIYTYLLSKRIYQYISINTSKHLLRLLEFVASSLLSKRIYIYIHIYCLNARVNTCCDYWRHQDPLQAAVLAPSAAPRVYTCFENEVVLFCRTPAQAVTQATRTTLLVRRTLFRERCS